MNLADETRVGALTIEQQQMLLDGIEVVEKSYPFSTPSARMTIDGKVRVMPMSVEVMNLGPWGWWSDDKGSRYIRHHPVNGHPLPAIPKAWRELAASFDTFGVDCVHVVRYRTGAVLRLHRDRDEGNRRGKILIASIGDDATWMVKGDDGRVHRTIVSSGDVVTLDVGSGTRHLRHGIERVDTEPSLFRTSPLSYEGRISVSFRQGAAPF